MIKDLNQKIKDNLIFRVIIYKQQNKRLAKENKQYLDELKKISEEFAIFKQKNSVDEKNRTIEYYKEKYKRTLEQRDGLRADYKKLNDKYNELFSSREGNI